MPFFNRELAKSAKILSLNRQESKGREDFLIGFLRVFSALSGKNSVLRFFDKTCSIGWFFESVDDTLDSVLYQLYIPVYQKAKFDVFEFHIGEELRHMDWMNISSCI